MGLIIVQRSPLVIGGSSRRGVDGMGVASVVIDQDKHLIVTLTNGSQQDAGQLPSSDEVESIAAQLAEVVASVEQLQQVVGALSDQVVAQTQTIALLTERVVQLEQGAPIEPEIPTNALTGTGGQPLVTAGGEYLVFGPAAENPPANALAHQSGELLTSDTNQFLTIGEPAV